MASLNHCSFIGNLGRDPETRFFSNGDKITNASIACTESWKDKTSGEKKERTEWVNLVFTGGLADVAEKYLRKGSQIHVSENSPPASGRTRKASTATQPRSASVTW